MNVLYFLFYYLNSPLPHFCPTEKYPFYILYLCLKFQRIHAGCAFRKQARECKNTQSNLTAWSGSPFGLMMVAAAAVCTLRLLEKNWDNMEKKLDQTKWCTKFVNREVKRRYQNQTGVGDKVLIISSNILFTRFFSYGNMSSNSYNGTDLNKLINLFLAVAFFFVVPCMAGNQGETSIRKSTVQEFDMLDDRFTHSGKHE